jgi:ribosomal protein L31
MKPGIHPDSYRVVVFKDMSNEDMFLGKSCANTKDTVKWADGNEALRAPHRRHARGGEVIPQAFLAKPRSVGASCVVDIQDSFPLL